MHVAQARVQEVLDRDGTRFHGYGHEVSCFRVRASVAIGGDVALALDEHQVRRSTASALPDCPARAGVSRLASDTPGRRPDQQRERRRAARSHPEKRERQLRPTGLPVAQRTLYLMCVTLGASITRICFSLRAPRWRP